MGRSANLVVKWIVAGFLDGRVAELLANLNLDDGVNVKARELHALNYRDGHLQSKTNVAIITAHAW